MTRLSRFNVGYLLTPETLLRKYLGKTVKVYRYNEHTGVEEEKQAEIAVEGAGRQRLPTRCA